MLVDRLLPASPLTVAKLDVAMLGKGTSSIGDSIASCCSCRSCDGCSVVGRRLSLMGTRLARPDCCYACGRFANAVPAAGAPPAAHGIMSKQMVSATPAAMPGFGSIPAARTWPTACAMPKDDSSEVELTNTFDVVLCRSQEARETFQDMVGRLQCYPNRWSQMLLFNAWMPFKNQLQNSKDLTNTSWPLPLLAMNDETPCAAALSSSAEMNEQDTFFLLALMGSAPDQCKGGGAAILCHLIRNSQNKKGEFSPLQVVPVLNEPRSKQYFESFGCKETFSDELLKMLEKAKAAGAVPAFTAPWLCEDPSPSKCDHYVDVAFDADAYFGDLTPLS
eukprot:gnl/TRDRNA2_/TRDRNA2_81714_c0_seq1.p1 gnl/TRDRNA2_/TRDRNA2_81714_c0~~gnl/TRDRNA2_/TRDRNA2_81714_c0_seq1.p1  ORF type:complete len:388 (-),score=54.74 gnl/TRDRNA2_/TRDRNA2_81714_c0_seq1:93-1094(-)